MKRYLIQVAYPMDDLEMMPHYDEQVREAAGLPCIGGGCGASWSGGCNPAEGSAMRDNDFEADDEETAIAAMERVEALRWEGICVRVQDRETDRQWL